MPPVCYEVCWEVEHSGGGNEYGAKPCGAWGIGKIVKFPLNSWSKRVPWTREGLGHSAMRHYQQRIWLVCKFSSYSQTAVNEQWSEDEYFSLVQRPWDWKNKKNGSSEEDHVLKDTEELLMNLRLGSGHTEWNIATVGHLVKGCLYSQKHLFLLFKETLKYLNREVLVYLLTSLYFEHEKNRLGESRWERQVRM